MDIDDDQAQEIQLAIDIPETPIARLIRAWTDERHAPDLLVFQGDLLDGLLQRLHEQAVMVTHLQTDPNTTEEEHLRLTLVMTDMERVKFMVRSYVRVRLHKIEKYAPHIMGNPRMQEKLSVAELTHAQRYQALLASHFHASVLDALPVTTHALDQRFPDGSSMISQPDKDQAVFIQARVLCPNVLLPDGDDIDLECGQVHILRYRTIEHLLSRGDVCLV
ncbi:GINS complex subunit [Tulasnella sp. JGI-2019a]|nr:GINS complex subunit [Tulasnella sp. JGI-2019a]